MISTSIKPDNGLSRATSPQGILQSVLAGLNEGRISKVVEQFDELFTFDDHVSHHRRANRRRLLHGGGVGPAGRRPTAAHSPPRGRDVLPAARNTDHPG